MSPDRQLLLPNPEKPFRERLERIPNHQQRVPNFRSQINRLGVDALVFDADNTLFKTHGLFTDRSKSFCDALSQVSGIDPKVLKQSMDELWVNKWRMPDGKERGMLELFGVDPLTSREAARL